MKISLGRVLRIMLKIYDYKCTSTDKVVEKMTHHGEDLDCSCGSTLKKMITPISFKLDNSFPGYADKWARDHESGAKRG
jgi:predicted nucleic acid-binding Zn ribbon protein